MEYGILNYNTYGGAFMKKSVFAFLAIAILLLPLSGCSLELDGSSTLSADESEIIHTENGQYLPVDEDTFFSVYNFGEETSSMHSISPASYTDTQQYMLTNINAYANLSLEETSVSFSAWQHINEDGTTDLGYYLVCTTNAAMPEYYALNLFDYKLYFWGTSIGEQHQPISVPPVFKTPESALLYIKDVMCADSISFYEDRPPLVFSGSAEDPLTNAFTQTEPFEFNPNMFSSLRIVITNYTEDYYLIHVYEIVDDFSDSSSPNGHTATWGWYTVYKWGVIKNEINFDVYIVNQ